MKRSYKVSEQTVYWLDVRLWRPQFELITVFHILARVLVSTTLMVHMNNLLSSITINEASPEN